MTYPTTPDSNIHPAATAEAPVRAAAHRGERMPLRRHAKESVVELGELRIFFLDLLFELGDLDRFLS